MTWGIITDEGLAEAASLIGTPLRRTRMQWIEAATRDAMRHFALGIGDINPPVVLGSVLDSGEMRERPSGTEPQPCDLRFNHRIRGHVAQIDVGTERLDQELFSRIDLVQCTADVWR